MVCTERVLSFLFLSFLLLYFWYLASARFMSVRDKIGEEKVRTNWEKIEENWRSGEGPHYEMNFKEIHFLSAERERTHSWKYNEKGYLSKLWRCEENKIATCVCLHWDLSWKFPLFSHSNIGPLSFNCNVAKFQLFSKRIYSFSFIRSFVRLVFFAVFALKQTHFGAIFSICWLLFVLPIQLIWLKSFPIFESFDCKLCVWESGDGIQASEQLWWWWWP